MSWSAFMVTDALSRLRLKALCVALLAQRATSVDSHARCMALRMPLPRGLPTLAFVELEMVTSGSCAPHRRSEVASGIGTDE